MHPPSPFTQIVQMLSALLGGVWGRLFLSRKDRAEANVLMETMRAFDELLAQWRAGTLVPEVEVEVETVAERKVAVRVRAKRTRSASPRRRTPAKPEARRRIVRLRPVNWAVIPRRIGPGGKRRKVTVPRCGEWSG